MHIELTVYPTIEIDQKLSLNDLREAYIENCVFFRVKNLEHKLYFIDTDTNEFQYLNPKKALIYNTNKVNETFRLEFEEMYGWIILEKFNRYQGLVAPFELIYEGVEKSLIEQSKQLGYCYNLSSDVDKGYDYLNPIYLIAFTLAQFCMGYVQINDDSRVVDFECACYSLEEFKQALKAKYS